MFIHETEEDGYYDPELARGLAKAAADLGFEAQLYGVPVNKHATVLDPDLSARIEAVDCAVFLARLGDQIRFRSNSCKTTQVMSYALDCNMMGSPFGETNYAAFAAIKRVIDNALATAEDIHVTCSAGTDYRGSALDFNTTCGDTTLKRFPLSVFTPVPSKGFTGRIAQVGFLTGTGSNFYTPWSCEVKDILFVKIEGSRIVEFDGAEADVDAAKAHYEFVGKRFDIDTYGVHSWHAGIHPGLSYEQEAARHFERWSGGAFGNPRILHIHTCGGYPPGEISLNVLDPTVRLDGVAVWDEGRLHPERLEGGTEVLSQFPELKEIFDHPKTAVGQAPCGRLAYA
ncbi:hypothetical protein [Neptunicoccus cionae]|uniref:Uncharacterized protein n=1 Tax=Neptunicoccus cionae TaxID=2035344 RepID=A0A916VRQ5_9RHOB|nr:hypothetical protein [Amylibacter cionae]GGA25293.1 hypothetical protein GCM10011498_27730 [Amylibacter cionae]